MIEPSVQDRVDRFDAARIRRLKERISQARQVMARYRGGGALNGYGAFGEETIDLERLTRSLKGAQEDWDFSREVNRLQALDADLPPARWTPLTEPEPLAEHYGKLMAPHEELVGLLRFAQALDSGHPAPLRRPHWHDFTDAEQGLCPPLLVDGSEARTGELLDLLALGLPVKLWVQQPVESLFTLRSGRAAALSPAVDLGWLALQMRRVFCLSAPLSLALDWIEPGLASGRAALLHLIQLPEALNALAVTSKTLFPLVYDPDHRPESGQPFTWLGPKPGGAGWSECTEEGLDQAGEAFTRQVPCTPADFLARLPGQESRFSPLDEGEAGLPLDRFLSADAGQRHGRVPTVKLRSPDLRWSARRVPPWLVYFCQDRLDHWQQIHRQFQAPQAAAKPASAPAPPAAVSDEEAVRKAMARLSAKLVGLEPSDLATLAGGLAVAPRPKAAPAAPAQAAPAAQPSGLPWIESERCTSCDECTKINQKLFAYDDQKRAYIKNPQGGPFRDLVKAAEKCSAAIIHPGTPQNPQEKDLEKWIKRASKYP